MWHDPVVEIYSIAVCPGVSSSAEAYDLANRRWYQLNVDIATEDEKWLSSTVIAHLRKYFDDNKAAPPWNSINWSMDKCQVSFECKPIWRITRTIQKSLSYGSSPNDLFPTISVDTLTDLKYISRSADRCSSRGRDCVFKRIEFDVDIEVIEAEIRCREMLYRAMTGVSSACFAEEMEARFCLVPILAVVLADRPPWIPNTVAGILSPYAGRDLEKLVREEPGPSLTLQQFRELAQGVQQISECGVLHGDVKYWNTVLQPAYAQGGSPKLMLIDIGTIAPGYKDDADGLAKLFLWCWENVASLRNDAYTSEMILAAADHLFRGNFEEAIICLSD